MPIAKNMEGYILGLQPWIRLAIIHQKKIRRVGAKKFVNWNAFIKEYALMAGVFRIKSIIKFY